MTPSDENSPPASLGTVLVVDDQEMLLRLASRCLLGGGYAVLVAGSAARALELLASHGGPVDLLMTDVVMPGMDGRALARAVAARRPSVKVLYTSGYDDVVDPDVDFLAKPYTPSALLQKVAEVLSRR